MSLTAKFLVSALAVGVVLASRCSIAQDASLPYMNPQLSPEQRATDLVHRMTLAEKATQMQNNSAAVPRLNIPAYQWWSEALHGVINEGVTEYPEPIGLAATFDAPGIHTMAAQIGIEGRIKHVQNVREGHTASWEASISGPRI
jgi:beta-glucosidase